MKRYFYKLSPFYIVLIVVITVFQACIKEKIDLSKASSNSISPQLAGPLIYSSLTLADIMSKANTNGQITDSAGFIILVYKGNLFSLPAANLVTIPAQTPANYSYALTAADAAAINTTPVGLTYMVKDSSLINFQAGGTTQINTLNCKTANLTVTINYGIKHNAIITITIPGAISGSGVPFSQSIPITYSGSPVNITQNYSLNGYTIDMTDRGTTHSTIDVLYSVAITEDANPTNVGDAVSFSETFSNVTYNSIIGYLGQQALSPNTDTIPITIFKNSILGSGTFHLVNPQIKVFLTNSYGLPIQANFNIFDGYTPGQPLMPIIYTGSPNPLSPLIIPLPATIGQSAVDSFKLNNTNSNIVSLVNNLPKNIIYNVTSLSNPAGPVYTNFITDTSLFKVDMEVDLPLWGTASNFMFQDTVKYSFGLNPTVINDIKTITIRSYISNGFPIDVGMSLTFVDSAYNVIDQLITPPNTVIIHSASIGSNGMVTSPTTGTNDFVIPASVIPQLNNVRHILIGAVASTINSGSTNVKIYDSYHLDVKLGVDVQMLLSAPH